MTIRARQLNGIPDPLTLNHRNRPQMGFTVIYDPDPWGGFIAGAKLGYTEVCFMLQYRVFTDGTILEWHECEYIVDNGRMVKREL